MACVKQNPFCRDTNLVIPGVKPYQNLVSKKFSYKFTTSDNITNFGVC